MKISANIIWGLLVLQLVTHVAYTVKINGIEEERFQCERSRVRDLTAIMKGYNEFAEYERAYQAIEKKMERRKTILVGR